MAFLSCQSEHSVASAQLRRSSSCESSFLFLVIDSVEKLALFILENTNETEL